MEKCKNCEHLFSRDICYFCNVKGQEIKHPYFMGGSKKCPCYSKIVKRKEKFKYPEKEELEHGK